LPFEANIRLGYSLRIVANICYFTNKEFTSEYEANMKRILNKVNQIVANTRKEAGHVFLQQEEANINKKRK